jgi:hypothetical protein
VPCIWWFLNSRKTSKRDAAVLKVPNSFVVAEKPLPLELLNILGKMLFQQPSSADRIKAVHEIPAGDIQEHVEKQAQDHSGVHQHCLCPVSLCFSLHGAFIDEQNHVPAKHRQQHHRLQRKL